MPRTLLLTIDFPPRRGGVARYLHGLADFFKDELFVVAELEKGSEVFDAEALFRVERKNLLGGTRWPRWRPAVDELIARANDYDTVLVSHVLPIGTAALLAKRKTGKPYIVIAHGMDIGLAKASLWKKWLAGKVLRGAKVVVANSEALAHEIEEIFGVKATLVVYPPVQIDSPLPEGGLRGVGERFHLLTVGRLVERKGHLRVLEALSQLKRKADLAQTTYTIIGNGPMLPRIQKAIEVFGLEKHVVIIADASDTKLAEYYQKSDLFVMPTQFTDTDREGFGMVYIEAALRGIPSIGTDHPGVDEAILANQTGLLIPDGDIEALATAIKDLALDPVKRQKLGQEARKRAESVFTPQQQFEKLRPYL